MENKVREIYYRLDQQFKTQAHLLPIEINSRFQRTLGQYCYCSKTNRRWFRFQSALIKDSQLLHQVATHEYIHYYLDTQHRIYGHGKEFKGMCRLLGISQKATFEVSPDFHRAKYQIICQNCNMMLGTRYRITQQFANKIAQSRCKQCQGKVVIYQVEIESHN